MGDSEIDEDEVEEGEDDYDDYEDEEGFIFGKTIMNTDITYTHAL